MPFSLDLKPNVTRRFFLTAFDGIARSQSDLASLSRHDLTGTVIQLVIRKPGSSETLVTLDSTGGIAITDPVTGEFCVTFQPSDFRGKTAWRGEFQILATYPSGDVLELGNGDAVLGYRTTGKPFQTAVFGKNTVYITENAAALFIDQRGPKGDPGAPGPPGPGLEELDINFSLIYQISKL